jgi:Eco57I restriction-modification methylase
MQGQLFTQDFLLRGIRDTPPYRTLLTEGAATFAAWRAEVVALFAPFGPEATLNEAQTEQQLIHPLLRTLGWGENQLPQVNLSVTGREDVPDLLLFADAAALGSALAEPEDHRRWRHGVALLEAKRWLRPLDRGDTTPGLDVLDPGAPSSQMLRYLSRADVVSDRAVKWGLLTNGAVWRLYWQDARSRAEEFFEIDLGQALPGIGLLAPPTAGDGADADHLLRLFHLMFGRSAFAPQDWDAAARSFHAYARNEARLYEEAVSKDLGARVFGEVFPRLAHGLARGDLEARKQKVGYGQFTRQQYTRDYLEEVREAALVLLYRLLFLFYAEDRHLLPVRDPRYQPYSARKLREDVRDKVAKGLKGSSTIPNLWLSLQNVFRLIDEGDDEIGMPAYNGGLFDRARSPLLERTNVPDAVLLPILDALSRRTEDMFGGWINYRDLSVSHLGGIYERLLEYTLVHEVQAADTSARGIEFDKPEIDRITAQPASFARKVSGSYYTHDDLVRLILRESVGLLASERIDAFMRQLARWRKKTSLNPGEWDVLDKLDPASTILELKVCDPAMGSGHFLVALVDDLADRVLEAATSAEAEVAAQPWAAHLAEAGRPWRSPLVQRLAGIRQTIQKAARQHGWAVTEAQLDDRHIVRRMILKKTIFGVDKNLMAVELAKTALWLHTFTVGAPLSFLDHHLKVGDSLHGERLSSVLAGLQALGGLFQMGELQRLELAAKNLARVADFTDVDIAEARLSKQLAAEAQTAVAPLYALLDFWRALRWLLPAWPVDKAAKLAKAGDAETVAALTELLNPARNLVAVLAAGTLDGKGSAVQAANALLVRVRELAKREMFFHWWTAFPTVFKADGGGGFDAVIGNPPWDRIKLQEVEWFAERDEAIARQARAADRKRMIGALREKQAPLWADYQQAVHRAEAHARVLGKAGDYPLLGGGDVNLYSLFVERAQALAAPSGLVALLTPSGIAADKGAAEFFRSISTTGRLGALFDFENRKVFFADVHASFKFCALVFGGTQRSFKVSRCAFFLHRTDAADDPDRVLNLQPDDFALLNPNTGAAPVFRSQRDAEITKRIYRANPVLVAYGELNAATNSRSERRSWPIRYVTAFHMTGDSALFVNAAELSSGGYARAAGQRWCSATKELLPLYVGRMIHLFDHRHASVTVNEENLHNAALGAALDAHAKSDPSRCPTPQYWVPRDAVPAALARDWSIGLRDIARVTDVRTVIACIVPSTAAGNTLPLLLTEGGRVGAHVSALLLANLCALAFDYVARQKAQSTHLNWYILEQLPVIRPERFESPLPAAFTSKMRAAGLMNGHHPEPTVADFVIPQVLALSYTAHDLAPFARDLGYVDSQGQVLPPITWDPEDRRARMAALDALFFHLYGLSEADAAYILSTFPIVRDQDLTAFGHYRTEADILALLPSLQSPPGGGV